MGHTAVFCLCSDQARALELINQLRGAGFANDDISALLPDKTGLKDFGYERHTKAPEGALAGGLMGGLLGAALGWLAWLGVLPLHALSSLVGTGVGLASLAGMALGALAGLLLGALLGLARPEYEARRFQGKVPGDNILISVHCENRRAVHWAKRLCKDAGATGIAAGAEALAAPARAETAPPVTQSA